jgi:hypothetical protein
VATELNRSSGASARISSFDTVFAFAVADSSSTASIRRQIFDITAF